MSNIDKVEFYYTMNKSSVDVAVFTNDTFAVVSVFFTFIVKLPQLHHCWQ